MKNIRNETVAAGVLAILLVFSPLAGGVGSILISQMNSYSRIDSMINGHTQVRSDQVTVPPYQALQPPGNHITASVSDRITSLLYSDVASWAPPEDRVYNMDPPVHPRSGATGRMSWDDLFSDPPVCGCCV
jgi:hypothetical protein